MKQPLVILFHSRPLAFISGLASVSEARAALTLEISLRGTEKPIGVKSQGRVAQMARTISGAIYSLCHSERSRGISHFNNY